MEGEQASYPSQTIIFLEGRKEGTPAYHPPDTPRHKNPPAILADDLALCVRGGCRIACLLAFLLRRRKDRARAQLSSLARSASQPAVPGQPAS